MRIGDYVTEGEKPFGHGRFGVVWAARHLSDGARVALKLVLSTQSADSRERLAAERHGAILQQRFERTHAMVPKVYDFGPDGDDFYIAMELIEGGSLTGLIAGGPMDARLATEYALRICDFLDKAHCFATTIEGENYERVVHADLKPDHVLVPTPGEIKVVDFGIAKALARTTQVTTDNWGTVHYASPERLESGRVNEHVDFWSVGVMLHEMISGRRPYWRIEGHRSQLEHAIRTNAPRESLPPSCPPALAAIVNKLLAYQLERRYPSAAAIRSDLELFLSGGEPVATKEYVTEPTVAIRPAPGAAPRVAPPLVQTLPGTDPLPVASPAAASVAGTVAAARPGLSRHDFLQLARRVVWLAVLLFIVGIVGREGIAWVAAERFRDGIEALDARTLHDKKQAYDAIRKWGLLDLGLRIRVDRALTPRLVALADAVIADYRREEPMMGPADWQQANEALRWALEASPYDRRVRAKELESEAHVARLAARGLWPPAARQLYQVAVEKFRRAAALDDDSFDPYLGISRIEVYGLDDVDAAAVAIKEAEKRGFVSGRRESAQLGDGYLKRAEKSRRLARSLSGDQRRRELESARDDFARCVAAFDPILGFANSAHNFEFCKARLDEVNSDLAEDGTTATADKE
jgi:hypothetical protein